MTARTETTAEAPPAAQIKCPVSVKRPGGEQHTIVGCGTWIPDIRDHEGIVDCPECGLFFDPDQEP